MFKIALTNQLQNFSLPLQSRIYIELKEDKSDLCFASDASAQRQHIRLIACITMTIGDQTFQKNTDVISSFSQTSDQPFANFSQEQGVYRTLAQSLAHRCAVIIASYG